MLLFVLLTGATTTMDLWSHIPSFLGGGGVVAFAEVIRRAYTTRVKERENEAKLADGKDARDADDSRSFVLEANAERRDTLRKVEAQASEITRLSVELARYTAKHELNELRDAEKDAQLKHMNLSLEMTQQLVTKQREEIDAQERVIEAQGREISNGHQQIGELQAQFAALKGQFEDLVKQSMGVRSISEMPGAT
jgi:chromosome segregation ATPase